MIEHMLTCAVWALTKQSKYKVCNVEACASVCVQGKRAYGSIWPFTVCPCNTMQRGTLGSNEFTAKGSLPIYLACPILLTLGSAVPQHPLLKTSFTKSQSVPCSKQPHLKSVPELHAVVSECWLPLIWKPCKGLSSENTLIIHLGMRTFYWLVTLTQVLCQSKSCLFNF